MVLGASADCWELPRKMQVDHPFNPGSGHSPLRMIFFEFNSGFKTVQQVTG
jgi:hypothetical protein